MKKELKLNLGEDAEPLLLKFCAQLAQNINWRNKKIC